MHPTDADKADSKIPSIQLDRFIIKSGGNKTKSNETSKRLGHFVKMAAEINMTPKMPSPSFCQSGATETASRKARIPDKIAINGAAPDDRGVAFLR